jgi:glycosyltransferase 2 family protein
MATKSVKKSSLVLHIRPKQLLLVLALVLVLYVIVPQLGSFSRSFDLIQHAQLRWVVFGAVCYLGTSIMSAGIYLVLAPRKLPPLRTVVVQYGSSFANRLLPAGIGALGVGYFYLRKQRCTPSASLALVTLNNMLGTVGHMLLLVLIAVFLPSTFRNIHLGVRLDGQAGLLLLGAAIVVTAAVILFMKFGSRLRSTISSTLVQLVAYRHKKVRLAAALACSLSLTLLHATCLWASATALHSPISIAAAVVILGIGVSVGAAIPSPGGLGGAEAGLVAGLVAFNVAAPTAIAVAILYRLATYWLGFVVGAFAFAWSTRRSYF